MIQLYKKQMVALVSMYILFAICAMTVMLWFCARKDIVIEDIAQDQLLWQREERVIDSVNTTGEMLLNDASNNPVQSENLLHFMEGSSNTNYLCIPLTSGIKPEQVHIENYYMEKQLRVAIDKLDESFYRDNPVYGNISEIEKGTYQAIKESVQLTFQLRDVYEYKSILENDCLYIELLNPKELYDRIIVIDAGHGGENTGYAENGIVEKKITLEIVKKLKEMLDETDIKVYYTRISDVDIPEDERIAIGNRTKADMFISIHANLEEDSKIYGVKTLYNENFFIPGFGSVELADLMEREVVTSISGKALGLEAAGNDEIVINDASIPATMVKVGCLSNAQEAKLLNKDTYLQRIAEGIYQGIMKAYEEKIYE